MITCDSSRAFMPVIRYGHFVFKNANKTTRLSVGN